MRFPQIDRSKGKPTGADCLFGSTASQASRKQVVGRTPAGPVAAVLLRFVAGTTMVVCTLWPRPAHRAESLPGQGGDELVDAVLGASRALVAVAARSLATVADDVTLAQYRVLIELAARGPQRLADLASALAVERSTATRMCDRLVRKRLVTAGGHRIAAGCGSRSPRRAGAGGRGQPAPARGDRGSCERIP